MIKYICDTNNIKPIIILKEYRKWSFLKFFESVKYFV